MSDSKGPRVARYIGPLLDVLRELDGSAKSREATEAVVERVGLTEAEQAVTNESGQTQAYNDIAWARFFLAKAGLIDSSQRGVWKLTPRGESADLDDAALLNIARSVQQGKKVEEPRESDVAEASVAADDAEEEELQEELGFNDRLLATLRGLSPGGFERLCRELLLEAGFERVDLTPPGKDGGIDGEGLLPINPFVTFKVLFQCKRYSRSVSAPQVRELQGVTGIRADKALLLTTGTFTADARREARRDGQPSVELVDGNQLVELFRRLELGLTPRTVFEIDDAFFARFRD